MKSLPNPFYANHGQPGQVPSFINSQGAQVIIAGGMGSRAVSFFQQFGIEPVTGVSGKVRDAVEAYVNGRLGGAEPCAESRSHGGADWRAVPPPGEFESDDVSRLKEEVTALRKQFAEAQERLNRLENLFLHYPYFCSIIIYPAGVQIYNIIDRKLMTIGDNSLIGLFFLW